MAEQKTYLNRDTGVVSEYPPALAEQFPSLEEVEPGTKPLAYTPIDPAAVAEYRASQQTQGAGEAEDVDAPAPTAKTSLDKENKA